ncbi:iron complex outermembrane recepter protein [Desulfocicer vacuolatum DSM 3385]|uniref:Iron complex outermembrane recepter protein n=1 Tax=Desulfocicer vacuolatum DSM 3385 TaxID=1121400 RepID=A0A1W2DDD0_9BACT|nr:TonB-dependent receptor [Desulfocicer vacuolatum]SMC95471.1 iron complex outermembrane recepter protein [Desulfocicer vacuolatum DSM 3385]
MRLKTIISFVLMGLTTTLLGMATAPNAAAAEESIQLETILVTATKTKKNIQDAPGSLTVINREELKKQNIQTVDDALNSLSGMFVKRTKGLMDATPSVSMRGFKGGQYTLVLLDGQPLNDAYTAGVEWGTLPVNNIERIEVVRGAASALYGGNAMGGVINIITRNPDKLELEAGAGYGSNNTRRYRFNVGNRLWDRLSLRLGYEKESTDGYVTTPVLSSIKSGNGNVSGGYAMDDKHGEPTKWVVGDKGDNGGERSSIDGKASFDFSDTGTLAFTAVAARHEYYYGAPNTYMGTFGDTNTYAVAGTDQRARFQPNNYISYTGIGENETDTYTLSCKELIGPVELHARLGTVQSDDRYTLETQSGMADYYTSQGSLKNTENESWFTELSGNIPLGQSHLLTLGTTYRTDASDTNDYDVPFYRSFSGKSASTFYSGGNSKAWALFAQDEWQVTEPFSLYMGLRYDSWKVYDGASGVPGLETKYESNRESAISPKIAAVWKPLSNTTCKASVGHAFRAPTLYELYRSWQSGSTTYQSEPDLRPETAWTYELGVDQYFFDKKTRVSLTGYRNDIEDLIYYRVEGATKTRDNAGTARTYGVEFEASQKITDRLSLWGNVTYTDARIIDNPTDPTSENKQISGIPEWAWNMGLDTQYEWCKASVVGRYYSKLEEDTKDGVYGTYEPAFFLDAKVILTPLKCMELSLSVDNILDEEYYEYYKGDGRTFFAELTFRY